MVFQILVTGHLLRRPWDSLRIPESAVSVDARRERGRMPAVASDQASNAADAACATSEICRLSCGLLSNLTIYSVRFGEHTHPRWSVSDPRRSPDNDALDRSRSVPRERGTRHTRRKRSPSSGCLRLRDWETRGGILRLNQRPV